MTPTTHADTIQMKAVHGSSLIESDGWSHDKTTLRIGFHNGQTFEYRGLSPAIHDAYEAAQSKGKYFHASIKNRVQGVQV